MKMCLDFLPAGCAGVTAPAVWSADGAANAASSLALASVGPCTFNVPVVGHQLSTPASLLRNECLPCPSSSQSPRIPARSISPFSSSIVPRYFLGMGFLSHVNLVGDGGGDQRGPGFLQPLNLRLNAQIRVAAGLPTTAGQQYFPDVRLQGVFVGLVH